MTLLVKMLNAELARVQGERDALREAVKRAINRLQGNIPREEVAEALRQALAAAADEEPDNEPLYQGLMATDPRITACTCPPEADSGHLPGCPAGSAALDEQAEGPCPHMRPSWRMCPHCLGINSARTAAPDEQGEATDG